jgi:predicted PurR-regulated permease PerM
MFYSYLALGAVLFAVIQTFSLLSPILFLFLLILLISLAVNPVISRMRALKGGRRGATRLFVTTLVVLIALTGWAFFGPMKDAVTKLSERLPTYRERLQKPLIKMEQQAGLSEEKLQAEVITEIAQTAANESKLKAARQIPKPTPPKTAKESESIRSRLSQMIQGVVGSFTAVAFNAAQILVVVVTVFFGVIFTLMNPRPIFGAIFLIIPERHHEKTLIILQRLERFVTTWAFATLLAMLTLVAIVGILHEELYRNRFLPTLTDADLDRLARNALCEKQSVRK